MSCPGGTQSVLDLIGEIYTTNEPFGCDQDGSELIAGYIPARRVDFMPEVQIGPALVGPLNDQQLKIFRDNRPLAVDELGMQGPFTGHKIARHSAGRTVPLNYDWGARFDVSLQERPFEQDTLTSAPLSPGGLPAAHAGVQPVELLENPTTVYYTASPDVGWTGY